MSAVIGWFLEFCETISALSCVCIQLIMLLKRMVLAKCIVFVSPKDVVKVTTLFGKNLASEVESIFVIFSLAA